MLYAWCKLEGSTAPLPQKIYFGLLGLRKRVVEDNGSHRFAVRPFAGLLNAVERVFGHRLVRGLRMKEAFFFKPLQRSSKSCVVLIEPVTKGLEVYRVASPTFFFS